VEENAVVLAMSKHEGAGNDFLIMIDVEDRVCLNEAEVRAMSDRHFGIGADGVITLTGPSGGGEVTMALRNQDGSFAEISGNGVRCAAHEAVRSGLVASGSFSIMTGSGLRRVTCADPVGQRAQTSVEMGAVAIRSVDAERRRVLVDVGNPHLVIVVDDVGAVDVEADGAALQASHDGGINVEWISLHDAAHVSLAVYERGVGPTLACGSGSVAAVGAARALALCGDAVEVANPGGTLRIAFEGDQATLSGEVVVVADVLMPLVRIP
jgi:diaminopimelate epimerase